MGRQKDTMRRELARKFVEKNKDRWRELLEKHETFTALVLPEDFSFPTFRQAFVATMGCNPNIWARKECITAGNRKGDRYRKLCQFIAKNKDNWRTLLDEHNNFGKIARENGFSAPTFSIQFLRIVGYTQNQWYERNGYERVRANPVCRKRSHEERKQNPQTYFMKKEYNHLIGWHVGQRVSSCPFLEEATFCTGNICTNKNVFDRLGPDDMLKSCRERAQGVFIVCECFYTYFKRDRQNKGHFICRVTVPEIQMR